MEELIFNYVERQFPTGLEELVVEKIMEAVDGKS
jgi:hypothetical protein